MAARDSNQLNIRVEEEIKKNSSRKPKQMVQAQQNCSLRT